MNIFDGGNHEKVPIFFAITFTDSWWSPLDSLQFLTVETPIIVTIQA